MVLRPILMILPVIVIPDDFVPVALPLHVKVGNLIPVVQVDGVALFGVEVHPAEVLLLVLAHQIVAEPVLLQPDRRVVLEVQVEQGDVVGVLVVGQGHGFLADLEHDVAVEFYEHLWWCKLA